MSETSDDMESNSAILEHQIEKAQEYWENREGRLIKYEDMEDKYLLNAYNFIRNKGGPISETKREMLRAEMGKRGMASPEGEECEYER